MRVIRFIPSSRTGSPINPHMEYRNLSFQCECHDTCAQRRRRLPRGTE